MKHELKSFEVARYNVIGNEFSMLKALGFADEEINEAYAFCTCGWSAQAHDSTDSPATVRAVNMLIEHAMREGAEIPWCAEHDLPMKLGDFCHEGAVWGVGCRVEEPARHYIVKEAE